MNIEKIKLEQLKHYYLNCRKHNKKNIDAIKFSIAKFSQYKPLIVDKNTLEIIIGNGTYEALRQLNYEYAQCLLLDLTEEQRKILNVVDNKSSDLSTWNENLIDKIKQFDEQLVNILDFDQKFLKKFEKIQKLDKKQIEILEDDVILDTQQKILVNKPKTIKCPCCGKQIQL